MSPGDQWSPDQPSDTEVFEPGDEALDEEARLDPGVVEATEGDPSLDPHLVVDERELEEVGAVLDDPERLVVLDGGMDDPDGIDPPGAARDQGDDENGWQLDAPLAGDDPDTD